jgi:hypothetical protein
VQKDFSLVSDELEEGMNLGPARQQIEHGCDRHAFEGTFEAEPAAKESPSRGDGTWPGDRQVHELGIENLRRSSLVSRL